MGSVFYDLDVPDFAATDISMSGVLLTAGSARVIPTMQPDTTVAPALLPGPATSRREFVQSDTLNVFAEVYDNIPAQQTHRVDVTTTLVGETGREVFRSTQALAADRGSSASRTKNVTLGYATSVPLKAVEPGRYLLRVEAAAHGSGKAADAAPVSVRRL